MRTPSLLLLLLLSLSSPALAAPPLVYSGLLLGPNGQPVSGSQTFTFELWADEVSTLPAARRCQYTQSRSVDSAGRFTLELSPECVTALQRSPELWSQLTVAQLGSLPRVKVSGVPLAMASTRTVLTSDAGVSTTTDGLFCGATSSTNGNFAQQPGNLVGYRSGKAQCEQVCGSRTAHMCKGSEAIHSLELGLSMPEGWVKATSAVTHVYPGNSPGYSNDCAGWTAGGQIGAYKTFGLAFRNPMAGFPAPFLDSLECDLVRPILCCD